MSLVEQLYSSKWLAILVFGLLALSSCNGRNTTAGLPEPIPNPIPTPKENESANNDYLTIESITVGNTVSSASVESVITYEE